MPITVKIVRPAIALLCLHVATIAAAALLPNPGYSHKIWRVEDGLPQSRIQAISQTADGYLWIGTGSGLVRFDGLSFVVFGRLNTPAFKDDSVLSLEAAKDGSLWIGTEGGGLMRYREKNFISYSGQHGLSNLFVRSIHEDRSGALLIGTDRGIFLKKGERFVRLDGTPAVPNVSVSHILEDPAGRIWVAGNGLYRVERGVLSKVEADAARQWPEALGWLAERSGARVNTIPPAINAAARFTASAVLLQDDDGSTWIGGPDGLYLTRSNRVTSFGYPEFLPDKSILALYQDRERNVWAGTGDGLVRFSKAIVRTVSEKDGLGGDQVVAIARDRSDRMWIVTGDEHLYELSGDKILRRSVAGLSADAQIQTIFQDRDGCYWLGTANRGILRWQCGPLKI